MFIALVVLLILTGCYDVAYRTEYFIKPLSEIENKQIELKQSLQSEREIVEKVILAVISQYKNMKFTDVSKVINNSDLLVFYYGDFSDVTVMAFLDRDKIYVNIGCRFWLFGPHPAYEFLKDKIYQDLKKYFGDRVIIDNDFSKSEALREIFLGPRWNYKRGNYWQK